MQRADTYLDLNIGPHTVSLEKKRSLTALAHLNGHRVLSSTKETMCSHITCVASSKPATMSHATTKKRSSITRSSGPGDSRPSPKKQRSSTSVTIDITTTSPKQHRSARASPSNRRSSASAAVKGTVAGTSTTIQIRDTAPTQTIPSRASWYVGQMNWKK